MAKKKEYKPLLYTTTIRNPERYKDFMNILKRFDGQVLSSDVIETVEREIFKVGLYRPKRQPNSVTQKWSTTHVGEFGEVALTNEETKLVYDMNDPLKVEDIKGHKEAGFEKGWESRFQTQYSLMRSLGFVYYQKDDIIKFSETGIKLAESVRIEIADDLSVSREIVHPEYEQAAFLQAFAKQQRNNPFIRELNENIPLLLLLKVIRLINNDPDFNHCGISYQELPLLLFWKDNDADALYQRIRRLRQEHGYNPSDEVIQDICVNEILEEFKKFKLKSIVSEYPDDFVRKMRMTGLISFRGAGRFIDINHNEDEKITYIIEHYSNYSKFEEEEAYFNYMSSIDENLFKIESIEIPKNVAAQKLADWTTVYDWNAIKTELNALSTRSSSKDSILKFLPAPSRLEFLTALAIKSKMPNVIVIPNYRCDDEGLPTSTAGGNKGDIECFECPYGILVEVTMAEGRTQVIMEMGPIHRHLDEFRQNETLEDAQCIFIAPSIHPDTYEYIDFRNIKKKGGARPFVISEFVSFLEHNSKLYAVG